MSGDWPMGERCLRSHFIHMWRGWKLEVSRLRRFPLILLTDQRTYIAFSQNTTHTLSTYSGLGQIKLILYAWSVRRSVDVVLSSACISICWWCCCHWWCCGPVETGRRPVNTLLSTGLSLFLTHWLLDKHTSVAPPADVFNFSVSLSLQLDNFVTNKIYLRLSLTSKRYC